MSCRMLAYVEQAETLEQAKLLIRRKSCFDPVLPDLWLPDTKMDSTG